LLLSFFLTPWPWHQESAATSKIYEVYLALVERLLREGSLARQRIEKGAARACAAGPAGLSVGLLDLSLREQQRRQQGCRSELSGMSEQAKSFRDRARECRRLAREAINDADRAMLEETAAEVEAEAEKIEAEKA
jgi:hypothetical protein